MACDLERDEARLRSEFSDDKIELWFDQREQVVSACYNADSGSYVAHSEPLETYSVQKTIFYLRDLLKPRRQLKQEYLNNKTKAADRKIRQTRQIAKDMKRGMSQIQRGRIVTGG